MLLSKNMLPNTEASGRARCVARAAPPGSTPVAPAPNSASRDAQQQQQQQQQREAHAAFTASLEKVVSAHRGTPLAHRELLFAQLALQGSSAARLQRQTHTATLNMASTDEEVTEANAAAAVMPAAQSNLPLSQLTFKALLRSSLAAARLHHGCVTTPHLLLGLIAAGSASLAPAAAADADSSSSSSSTLSAAAEAAVVRLIDGPQAAAAAAAAGTAAAAASLLGRSCGLDVVQWVPQLSGPARRVLLQAEHLMRDTGSPLLTTHHLLAAMLQPPAANSSSSNVVQQLLQELGLDVHQVAAAAAAAEAVSSSSSSSSVVDEDGVVCEPLGFLHEEFYSSLCGELRMPAGGAAAAAAASAAVQWDTACLN